MKNMILKKKIYLALILLCLGLGIVVYSCFFRPKGQIYIAYHKPATLFQNTLVKAIHVGRDVAFVPFSGDGNNYTRLKITQQSMNWFFQNMIGDNTGDHISSKNRQFDMLTLFYWLWKNKSDLPYVGVMSYRYLLTLNPNLVQTECDKSVFLNEIGLTQNHVDLLMQEYEAIIPLKVHRNLIQHYDRYHYKQDLDLAVSLVKEKYPKMADIADEIIYTDTDSSLSNFFVLRQDLAQRYFSWLFSIILEVEKQKQSEILSRNLYQQRAYGFLAERLFAVFMAYMERVEGIKILYVPIVVLQNPDVDATTLTWIQMQGKEK